MSTTTKGSISPKPPTQPTRIADGAPSALRKIAPPSKYALDQVGSKDNLARIRLLIQNTPKIDVPETEDVILGNENVGYTGDWENRHRLMRESHRLTEALEALVAFNPNADSLYPGSLVQGKDLPHGILDPITCPRNPITITVLDFVGKPGSVYSQVVPNPSLSTVHRAVQALIAQDAAPNQPSKMSFNMVVIHSLDEAMLKLGASAEWLTGSVKGSFSYTTSAALTRVLVRFVQSYYTVACEAPQNPVSFIGQDASYTDFARYAGTGNPPTYVASVTFGRELWMLIESSVTESDLIATLNATFNAAVASGRLDVSTSQREILQESSIQVLALGGSGTAAVQTLVGDKIASLVQYFQAGANFTPDSPGVAISYVCKYLTDNSVARVSSTTDYTVITSVSDPLSPPLTRALVSFHTNDDDKDGDTRIDFLVSDGAGRVVGSTSGGFGHFDDNSESGDIMLSITDNASKADLLRGYAHIHIQPNGDDTWKFNISLRLEFADGNFIQKFWPGNELSESKQDMGFGW